ncbi:MAG: hypothetical protein ACOCYU_00525 [Brevefilum sp.]
MQKTFRFIIFMFVIIFVTGCRQFATQTTQDLTQLTPQQPTFETTVTPTPAPTLDPATEQTLRLYPLFVGNIWEYEYLGFDQGQEVVWQVVEKVTDVRFVDGYYVAVMERSLKLLDGDPPPDFQSTPSEGTFWYLVDGEKLYRFENQLFTQLSGAWLELVLPFPENSEAWYPNPDQRANLDMRTTGFRYASAPFKRTLPMGSTYTCYNVATRYNEGMAESTFCESIGFVYEEFNYYNRAYGYRSELRGFSIQ